MLDAKCATTLACDDVGRNAGPVEYKGYISAVTFALDKHATFLRTYRLTLSVSCWAENRVEGVVLRDRKSDMFLISGEPDCGYVA